MPKYYLSSLITIILGLKNPFCLLELLFRRPIVQLRIGYKFRIRSLLDLWIVKEVCLDNDYERIGINIEPDWTIIDAGAGIGDFAVHVAKRFPKCQIFSFEPNPETFKLLEENLKLNNISNVTANCKAITGREVHSLYLGSNPSLDSTEKQDGRKTIAIESVTLNSFLSNLNCNLLKMDCECAEYDILYSLTPESIKKIENIILEWHDSEVNNHVKLGEFLKSFGYHVLITPNPVHKKIGFLSASRTD